MKKTLRLKGGIPLSRKDLKNITGGLIDFVNYDPSNECQNATEIVPIGCPCNSKSYCSRRFGPGAIGNQGGPSTIEGACIGGVCAGSTGV
ncbi:hypothetical protein EG346_05120 [Chryseobacterium carnipullorum]|uniref:Uncharacterized protein n=1 Tax=Chryseobacterium carnipullorum TaxID=1124835 RepID=A0A1M7CMH7_CHRCU|nr:hypothetical protein [Chryseobacterium carnipullorum]AZA47606.1 hypothetical protein EG346_05120 [Chryseobacterium carnipullorum]AZA66932.1 hypothetical protein EG345_21255 [Chryseobacterium carnipullorum]SHL68488.1 hypothetical protein SAMN05444360_103280 [Chryseobacterium carnipullorum]STD10824.1 Uncharacterised protein [Chryseobacterium carnipullorum]